MAKRLIETDIIILDWNRPEDTIAAIRSALGQTGISPKVWVVDQGSTPKNRAKLAAFCDGEADVHVHWLEHNVGVAAGRNIATRLGSAAYVVALDNDAVFEDTDTVARAVARLESMPRLGGVAFRILDADTRCEAGFWDYPKAYLGAELRSFEVTRFLGGGYALRREAFERAGCYDEQLFFSGEARDVAWRIIGLGYTLRWYQDIIVLHRTTSTVKLDWSDKRYFYLVRNALYIDHKFGAGPALFARSAARLLVRGLRNGLGRAAVRGIGAGGAMCMRFSLSPNDKHSYRLTPEVRRYIAEIDLKANESSLQRFLRQLTLLPKI